MPSYNDNEQDNLKELLDSIKPDEAYEEGIESTPEELNISLLKHQRIGLKWMLDKEKSGNKGGILADDMGLGKTIQAISIMVANQSEDDKCKANLVVAPVSLLTQWAQEIDTKVKAKTKFTYYIYHQQNKAKSFKELSKYNVILISYNTLTSEMKKHFALALSELKNNAKLPEGGGGESYQSPFFTSDANFYRIILDEAQMIKNKLTQASKSVALLKSTYRWCLSGTPMQNSINELYPLLRFLRIRPYNDDERFKNAITAQLSTRGGENRALRKVQAILTAILLRRTKNSMIDGKPILELPDKHIVFDHVVMHDAEKRFYEALESSSKMKADKILNAEKIEGAGRGDYSSILTLLLRMRQACDHRYLVDIGEDKVREFKNETVKDGFHSAVKFSDETKRRIIRERKDGFTCQNCYDMISVDSNVVLLSSCGHAICKDCVDTFFDDNMETEWNGDKSARCKVCSVAALQKSSCNLAVFEAAVENNMTWPQVQKHFGLNQVALNTKQRNVKIQELIDNDGQGKIAVSAKIDKTLELIDEIEEKHPGEKIIIFSQFTMMFDVLQFFLNYRGVQFLRYDGTMNVQEKTTTISTFYQDPDKKLLLLSLKSGNVGLTLTCASHVIILEPFWNPYVEKQAQDRVHRISQTREVYIHRILIEGTIEDRIMELQKQKEDLVDSALDPEARKSATRLSRTEMRYLSTSCYLCQKRKQKCDQRSPSCTNCIKSNIQCVQPPRYGASNKPNTKDEYTIMLEKRKSLAVKQPNLLKPNQFRISLNIPCDEFLAINATKYSNSLIFNYNLKTFLDPDPIFNIDVKLSKQLLDIYFALLQYKFPLLNEMDVVKFHNDYFSNVKYTNQDEYHFKCARMFLIYSLSALLHNTTGKYRGPLPERFFSSALRHIIFFDNISRLQKIEILILLCFYLIRTDKDSNGLYDRGIENETLSVYYYRSVRNLIQPFLELLDPEDRLFRECQAAAGQICQSIKAFHQKTVSGHSIINIHTTFIAGVTLIYCLWLHRNRDDMRRKLLGDDKKHTRPAVSEALFSGLDDLRACSISLKPLQHYTLESKLNMKKTDADKLEEEERTKRKGQLTRCTIPRGLSHLLIHSPQFSPRDAAPHQETVSSSYPTTSANQQPQQQALDTQRAQQQVQQQLMQVPLSSQSQVVIPELLPFVGRTTAMINNISVWTGESGQQIPQTGLVMIQNGSNGQGTNNSNGNGGVGMHGSGSSMSNLMGIGGNYGNTNGMLMFNDNVGSGEDNKVNGGVSMGAQNGATQFNQQGVAANGGSSSHPGLTHVNSLSGIGQIMGQQSTNSSGQQGQMFNGNATGDGNTGDLDLFSNWNSNQGEDFWNVTNDFGFLP
ncbi:hypothetical protein CANARDRAFT_198460 [[Candida] arabinofermentans NRRL YB-2248]|uniref:RING-type domain-containing protein n=1 Tax=[Candida] arabinofermentans NRRL YB-2248 TaxID=983967 RepID=A0A1E4T140_9ASCO|nr:hypothetical protein CANARDRAFT_198460 [[Candida] arabinofermentans NRRL YB-2248]